METTLDLTDRTLLKDLHEYVLETRKMRPDMAAEKLANRLTKTFKQLDQHTECAECAEDKPTPLRIDKMGGYVCLTCIDKRLNHLLNNGGRVMAYTRWDDVEMCQQLSFTPTNDDYDGWQPLYAAPLALEDIKNHFFYSQPLRTHLAPYAYDAPDEDNEGGTTLVYANYYHRYDHPLPDVAKPLYAEPIDNVMLRKSISDLSDMYQSQCKCTDEWAEKYNNLLASIEYIKVVSA